MVRPVAISTGVMIDSSHIEGITGDRHALGGNELVTDGPGRREEPARQRKALPEQFPGNQGPPNAFSAAGLVPRTGF